MNNAINIWQHQPIMVNNTKDFSFGYNQVDAANEAKEGIPISSS